MFRLLPLSRLFVIILMGCAAASAKVVYVSPTGNDANSGLSWAQAKHAVQAGKIRKRQIKNENVHQGS